MKRIICLLFAFSSILSAKDNDDYTTDPYATHQPVLYEVASRTNGPIIEFGCGKYSTDLLHKICKKTNRLLITIEDDQEWLNTCAKKFLGDGYSEDNSGWHKFYFVPGRTDDENPDHWVRFLEEFDLIEQNHFSLCFIDQAPWLARFETLKHMKGKADYYIIHDVDYFPEHNVFGKTIVPIDQNNCVEGIYDFADVFKHFKVYYPLRPWPGVAGPPTLLGSDIDPDLPEILYGQYREKFEM